MRDTGLVLSVDTRSPLMCENQILCGCYQRELREPRRAWIDVTLPTFPPSYCCARQRCRTTLSWFQLRGETLWFSASVSPSCVGFFLVWRPCERSTELELFFSPQFSFSALFLCKRNFLQGANMVGEDIILVGKSSLLMF